MQTPNGHQQYQSDEGDRRNRFVDHGSPDKEQRATSQPPHSNGQNLSPSQQYHIPTSLAGGGAGVSPWAGQRTSSGLNPNSRSIPQSVPIRSSSFSAQAPSQFLSAMQNARAFASTFEDDESVDALSESYDERYLPPSQQFRGRQYTQDLTRSRSQSLATPGRPGPIGSPLQSSGVWPESGSLSSNPLNIPGSRYGPPGDGRYGLGASGRSMSNNLAPSSARAANGYSTGGVNDISNMSPFRRDVDQILLDDGSAFRELWAGMNPPRDENGGGGSGTTSRRHSVSVVQPRGRGTVVGFNAPGNDGEEPAPRTSAFQTQPFRRGGLMLSDDDLASDLGMLNINPRDGPGPVSSSAHPPSQPTSLPIYAPLSRSPPASDRLSPYQSINLAIPTGSSFSSRQQPIGSPSESGLSGGSPTRSNHSQFDPQASETPYLSQQQQAQLTARFIPGQGIQYLPTSHANGIVISRASASYGGLPSSPISPTTQRTINPQQPPHYPQQIQRRPSDTSAPLNELGKGVPLHSVPASWPLYIVEFKAGRTDLFYLTDLSVDIRVGDLVIVEADRGKDLGKVVNDSITLKEVEEFQREQLARAGFSDGQPLSPGGAGGGQGQGTTAKKEINPKMIYGKAQGQDTQ